MEYIKVYADDDLRAALHTAASAKGVSDAEMARRLIGRGLAIDGSDAQATVLAEAVRAVIRDELRPVRRLSFLAAFEAARGAKGVEDALGSVLVHAGHRSHEDTAQILDRATGRWAQAAAQRTRDPEPFDPGQEAPAPLPLPDEEVTVSDPATAAMLLGE